MQEDPTKIMTPSEPPSEDLFAAVYDELYGLARRQMARQSMGHTLQPTALINEVYLKLARRLKELGNGGPSTEHFLGLASRAMRSILVDHARKKGAQKRTAEGARVALDSVMQDVEASAGNILDLDEALESLAATDSRMAALVELYFFGGCTMDEAAGILGISTRTAQREWRLARAKLRRELGEA